jgi:ABC-2 type transport system ATP-binding protein
MTDIITTRGLTKQYGKAIPVNEVDLAIPEGTIYGFLGPNGAGKSTTLKMILGLVRPTAGSITVFGKSMNRRNRLSILREVGSLIESPSYYGHLTGEENLQIIQTLRRLPASEITRVLEIVRLSGQKTKQVSQYSLGMKQRLGLAYALLGNPRLLILDEPTNGLDPAGIQEIRELICSLPREFGMTVLVSSHLLSEIDQIATSVGIISQGRLVFQNDLKVLHNLSRHQIAIRALDNQRLDAVLTSHNVDHELRDNYLLLPQLADLPLAKLVSYLASQDIGLVRIEERQKSLEEIFLELTGTAVSL